MSSNTRIGNRRLNLTGGKFITRSNANQKRRRHRRRLLLEGLETRHMLDASVTIDQALTQDDPTNSLPIHFTAVFSETTIGFDGSDVNLSGTAGGTLSALVTPIGIDGTTFDVAVSGATSDGTVIADIPAGVTTNVGGDPNLASTSTDNIVNFTTVTVTIDQGSGQVDPTSLGSVHFTAVFSEEVTGFDNTDVELSGTAGGTLVVAVTPVGVDGTTYDVEVTGLTTAGTVIADIPSGAAVDVDGNLNAASTSTDNTITFTTLTVTAEQATSQVDPTNTAPIHFTVVFSDTVIGFDSTDVTVGGTAGGTLLAVVTPIGVTGTSFDVAVSGMTTDGTVTVEIPAAAAVDGDGNPNAASISIDNVVNFTTVTATINQAIGQVDPTDGSPIHFTVVFSEEVTGFVDGDVTLSGTAGGTLAATVTPVGIDGTTYDVAVSGMTSDGTVVATIPAGVAADLDGNLNAESTSLDNIVNFTSVTVTINQAVSQIDPTNTSPIHFTAVFSEAVTGFTDSDVTLSGTATGTLLATVTPVGVDGTTYDVAVTGMVLDGTVIATVEGGAATDIDGNQNVASTSVDNVVNFTTLTVNINQDVLQADPTSVGPIHFTAVFSESVTGFGDSDVSLSGTAGGTLSATVTPIGVGDTTFDIAVSGMTSDGTVIASIPAGVAADIDGNLNATSTSVDNVVNFTLVTVTIDQAVSQDDPTANGPIHFTAVFSESVSGFTDSDVSLSGTAGGTLAASVTPVGVDGTTYDIAVSGMTSGGTVIANIPAGGAVDVDGNLNAASTSLDNVVSFTTLTVTIDQESTQVDPTNDSPIHFTAVFSDAVTGFVDSDVVLSGSVGGTLSVTVTPIGVSGTTFDVAVSGMTTDGTVIATIPSGVAADVDGNLNVASTSVDNVVDFTTVTATINQAAGQLDPTDTDPIHFTVVFSEAVSGFANNDVFLSGTAGGTLAATVTPVGVDGTTYDVAVDGMTSAGTVIAVVPAGVAVDVDGNLNATSTSTDNVVNFEVGTSTKVGLYDPLGHTFYLNNNTDGSTDDLIVYTTPTVPRTWVPLAGDWDGDGTDTVGLYDPFGHTFYLNNDTDGSLDNLIIFTTPYVPPTWIPIAGDWDGDGVDTVGLYDSRNHTFYLNNETDGTTDNLVIFTTPSIPQSWLPIAGDWDGDGDDTVGLYDRNNHTFYLNNETDGSVDDVIIVATPTVPRTWVPIAGDWNGDGIDTVGLYDRRGYTFYLNNDTDGSTDNLIVFTTPRVPRTWIPVAGDWNGSAAAAAISSSAAFPSMESLASGEGLSTDVEIAMDVDGNQAITPMDVLGVVNLLNAYPTDQLPIDAVSDPFTMFDTNGDGSVSPLDALIVINHLNRTTELPATTDAAALLVMALPGTGTSSADKDLEDAEEPVTTDPSEGDAADTVDAQPVDADEPWQLGLDDVVDAAAGSGTSEGDEDLESFLTNFDTVVSDIAADVARQRGA